MEDLKALWANSCFRKLILEGGHWIICLKNGKIGSKYRSLIPETQSGKREDMGQESIQTQSWWEVMVSWLGKHWRVDSRVVLRFLFSAQRWTVMNTEMGREEESPDTGKDGQSTLNMLKPVEDTACCLSEPASPPPTWELSHGCPGLLCDYISQPSMRHLPGMLLIDYNKEEHMELLTC